MKLAFVSKKLWICMATLYGTSLFSQAGSIDNTFNIADQGGFNQGSSGSLNAVICQPDGKILISGWLDTYNGEVADGIARLNVDGTLDKSFSSGTGTDNNVGAIALQSDGKIVIAGGFNTYNNAPVNYIARLNSNGTLDNSFSADVDYEVRALAIQTDGKILIGGMFTMIGGTKANGIARLNTNGTLDNTFQTGSGTEDDFAYGLVMSIFIQSDGKILIGGSFSKYNGTPVGNFARLNSDGSLDNTFNPGTGADDWVRSIKTQSGKVLIGGDFKNINGSPMKSLARLNADGSIDNTFNMGTGPDDTVTDIEILGDGKIIIAGGFAKYNGNPANDLARLNTNGSFDSSFNSGSGATDDMSDGFIAAVEIQSDGKIIAAGLFNKFNNTGKNNLVRLLGENNNSVEGRSMSLNLIVFPNPCTNVIAVKTREVAEMLIISDQLGKEMIQIIPNGNQTIIDVSTFSEGIYFVKVNYEGTSETIKFLVLK